MDMVPLFSMLATGYLNQLPIILAIVLGLVLVASNWRTHPRPAQLAGAGLGIMLILHILTPILTTGLQIQMMQNMEGMSMSRYGLLSFVLSFALSLLKGFGLGLVVWAIFAGRDGLAPGDTNLP